LATIDLLIEPGMPPRHIVQPIGDHLEFASKADSIENILGVRLRVIDTGSPI
jgi:hypothetical protein